MIYSVSILQLSDGEGKYAERRRHFRLPPTLVPNCRGFLRAHYSDVALLFLARVPPLNDSGLSVMPSFSAEMMFLLGGTGILRGRSSRPKRAMRHFRLPPRRSLQTRVQGLERNISFPFTQVLAPSSKLLKELQDYGDWQGVRLWGQISACQGCPKRAFTQSVLSTFLNSAYLSFQAILAPSNELLSTTQGRIITSLFKDAHKAHLKQMHGLSIHESAAVVGLCSNLFVRVV